MTQYINPPTVADIHRMVDSAFSGHVQSCRRFETGNHHFVHNVHLDDGRNVVVRVAWPDQKNAFEGALHWSGVLKPLGIPLPDILYADLSQSSVPFPFIILERVPGTDLKYAYSSLDVTQRQELVDALIAFQHTVNALPQGNGFGYVTHSEGPFPHACWQAVIDHALSSTDTSVRQNGKIPDAVMSALKVTADDLRGYFETVKPVPFLHDMTSKNVLIADGRCSGIVDVDSLCYGDRLYLPGLIQAAFIADGLDNDYIDYWKQAYQMKEEERRIVDFYAAQSLAYIISQINLPLNQQEENISIDELSRLQAALLALCEEVE